MHDLSTRVDVSADLDKIYSSVNEVLSDPSVVAIVTGKVTKTENVLTENNAYTICEVSLSDVVKGPMHNGDTIFVIEYGAQLSKEETIGFLNKSKAEYDDNDIRPISIYYEDYHFSKVGDENLYCLEPCASQALEQKISLKPLYVVAGAFQGKLSIENGKYIWETPRTLIEENPNLTAEQKEAIVNAQYNLTELKQAINENQ